MGKLAELELLAALLGTPGDESLEALQGVSTSEPWLQDAVAELAGIPLAEWQAEHTRLFVSGHPRTVCAPFASVWKEGKMQGQARDAALALYARGGFQPEAALPADFLGSELGLLAFLLGQNPLDEALVMDTLEHLRGWVPRFAKALRQESRVALYGALGERLGALFA
jgi:TorA maturation chaperone TorD